LENEQDDEIHDIPEPSSQKNPEFANNMVSGEPQRITQNELNDFVSSLELLKGKAELLESRLQQ
jgi:hypothetical protein